MPNGASDFLCALVSSIASVVFTLYTMKNIVLILYLGMDDTMVNLKRILFLLILHL